MLTKGYVTMSDLQSVEMQHRRWSDEEICDYYDTHPNETIKDLALRSGWSQAYIKRILMKGDSND